MEIAIAWKREEKTNTFRIPLRISNRHLKIVQTWTTGDLSRKISSIPYRNAGGGKKRSAQDPNHGTHAHITSRIQIGIKFEFRMKCPCLGTHVGAAKLLARA